MVKTKNFKDMDHVVYECFGSRYTFVDLKIEAATLVGTCTRNHKKTWLWKQYIQFDDSYCAPATLIEKRIMDEKLKNFPN